MSAEVIVLSLVLVLLLFVMVGKLLIGSTNEQEPESKSKSFERQEDETIEMADESKEVLQELSAKDIVADLSRNLSNRPKQIVIKQDKTPESLAKVGMKVELSYEVSAETLDIRELNKKATALKTTDLPKAIELLKKSQELSLKQEGHPISHYLRLPLFLQADGRMDEALKEFNRLLVIFTKPFEKKAIYDKMRLAYQREKNKPMVEKYKLLTEQAEIENEEYQKQMDIQWKQERAEHEQKMAERRERLAKYRAN